MLHLRDCSYPEPLMTLTMVMVTIETYSLASTAAKWEW
jgi:hypothetical protein